VDEQFDVLKSIDIVRNYTDLTDNNDVLPIYSAK
jgi:hypothetical protein